MKRKKQEISWIKAILIALVGSIVLKLVEILIQQIRIGQNTFSYWQIPFLIVVSMIFVLIFKTFNLNKVSFAFIPALYYFVKELYNFIFVHNSIKSLGIATIEAMTLGIFVGFVVYLIIDRKIKK